MNFSWFEDFMALATTGSFSRAAEVRHMTQPAFSRRIRALEEWLGVQLFDRKTHRVSLTEAGEWFLSVARDMLARVARIPEEARAAAGVDASTVRIASTHALSFTFLPPWLRRLESRDAARPIQLLSDVLQRCEALLQQERAHFLLCHWHPQSGDRLGDAYESIQVGSDVLVPATAPCADGSGPLFMLEHSGRGSAPILGYGSESGVGRIVHSMRAEAIERIHGRQVVTATLASVLRTMALDGRGIGWLPSSLVHDDLESGRLVRAGSKEWDIEVEIRLFRAKGELPRAAHAFWQAATQLAQ